MSPIDRFNEMVRPHHDVTTGKTPQTGEERLKAFRKEIDVEIANHEEDKWKRKNSHYGNIIEALKAAKNAADEESIGGNAEAAINSFFEEDEIGYSPAGKREAQLAANRAADRATSGKVFVRTLKEEPRARRHKPEFTPTEPPKDLSKREEFYTFFLRMVNAERHRLGEDKYGVKARALTFATEFSDCDPTLDRIGTRLLARHQGKIEGENDPFDKKALAVVYKIAKEALERAEKHMNYSTEEHVKQATPLIIEYISGKTSGGMLVGKERALQYVPHRYAQKAQEQTVLDFIKNSHMTHGLSKTDLEEIEQIAKDAVAYAHEQIDAPEASTTAEFEASVDGVDPPFEINDLGEDPELQGVDPAVIAANKAMSNPDSLTAAMNAMRGEPQTPEQEASFERLLATRVEILGDELSQEQIQLSRLLIEDGCLNREDIWNIANKLYRSGEIEAQEAMAIKSLAEKVWDQIEARIEQTSMPKIDDKF